MEIKILEDKKQLLFSRRAVVGEVEFGEGKTPSRIDLRNEMAKQMKVESKLLSIRKIETAYGLRKARVEAYIYQSEAELEKAEPKHIKKRHLPKEAKPAEGAVEPKKEEKKAEPKKEEKAAAEPKKVEKAEEKK